MDFNEFATDTVAEVEGKWFPLKDAKFKIARTGNIRYREKLRNVLNVHREAIDKNLMDLEVSDEVMVDILVDTILLDWEGMSLKGKKLGYSKAEARKNLLAFRDFREWVAATADKMENFRSAAEEADKGNSPAASSGT